MAGGKTNGNPCHIPAQFFFYFFIMEESSDIFLQAHEAVRFSPRNQKPVMLQLIATPFYPGKTTLHRILGW